MSTPTKSSTTDGYNTADTLDLSEDHHSTVSSGSEITTRSRNSSVISGLSKSLSWAEIVKGDYGKVQEEHCRVLYQDNRGSYKPRELICLKSEKCRGKLGGSHANKRKENQRVEPGIYKLFSYHNKLVGAIPDSKITLKELETKTEHENKIMNERMNKLIKERKKEVEKLLESEQEKQEKVEINKEMQEEIKTSFEDGTFNQWDADKQSDQLGLLDLKDQLALMKRWYDEEVMNLTKLHDAKQTATKTTSETKTKVKEEKPEIKKEKKRSKKAEKKSQHSQDDDDDIEDSDEDVESDRKPAAKDLSNKKKLYIIGKGHGDPVSVGFYYEKWDNISFITKNCSKSFYQKVPNETEGLKVLRKYFRGIGVKFPSWIKRKQIHYPKLSDVIKAMKKDKSYKSKKDPNPPSSSESSSDSESDSDNKSTSSSSSENSDESISSSDNSSDNANDNSDSESSSTSSSNSSSSSYRNKKRSKKSKKKREKTKKNKKLKKKSKKKSKSKKKAVLKASKHASRSDESVGEPKKLFGISINHHRNLVENIAPDSASASGAKILMETIDDFTAFPKVQGKKSNSNSEEWRNLTQALTGEKQFWNGNNDNNYNDSSRNVLGKVAKEKTSENFRKLATKLTKKYSSLLDTFVSKVAAALEFVYRLNSDECDRLAEQTLIYRIGRDILQNYMSLLNYHVGLLNTWSWGDVQNLLEYHAENLWEIRNEYYTRDQVMCRIYTYLRDGAKNNWVSTEVLQEQLVRQRTREDPGGGNGINGGNEGDGANQGDNGDGGDTTNLAAGDRCAHCRTCCIHLDGKRKCPWKHLTRNKAIAAANDFICKYVEEHMVAAVEMLRERTNNEGGGDG